MFLSLEFSQLGRGDDGKHFKSAFYRAIQVRPGSKRLYLDAARYDREALHEVEWNTIGSANTMAGLGHLSRERATTTHYP